MREKQQALLIVNPTCRIGREQTLEDLVALLSPRRPGIKGVLTTPTDHGQELVRTSLKRGVKEIWVVGGDGTLSEVVQGFFENEMPIAPDAVLGILPGGRGDDFFRSMSLTSPGQLSPWELGLKALDEGRPRKIDLARVSWNQGESQQSRYLLNIASFGFPGLVVKEVQRPTGMLSQVISQTRIGKSSLTYALNGVLALSQYQPLVVRITVDGAPFFSGPIHSGFILNGKFNAGGLCWDDEAKLDDGLLHCVISEPTSFSTTLQNTVRLFSRHPEKLTQVHRATGKKIEVILGREEIKQHPLFEIDGDLFEGPQTRGAVFEVLPSAIQIQSL